ncbi:hypothetical protein HPB47_021890 [Ixodes persulcatus]|uniref:Uncharacterized protein n=1 Tax=Ixodes persulcatus TaxID=34615 RepID=A0AC60QB85_IXOPE|nr:hypothetical protein HPB47_021890 [Ixodes persulcatus]
MKPRRLNERSCSECSSQGNQGQPLALAQHSRRRYSPRSDHVRKPYQVSCSKVDVARRTRRNAQLNHSTLGAEGAEGRSNLTRRASPPSPPFPSLPPGIEKGGRVSFNFLRPLSSAPDRGALESGKETIVAQTADSSANITVVRKRLQASCFDKKYALEKVRISAGADLCHVDERLVQVPKQRGGSTEELASLSEPEDAGNDDVISIASSGPSSPFTVDDSLPKETTLSIASSASPSPSISTEPASKKTPPLSKPPVHGTSGKRSLYSCLHCTHVTTNRDTAIAHCQEHFPKKDGTSSQPPAKQTPATAEDPVSSPVATQLWLQL